MPGVEINRTSSPHLFLKLILFLHRIGAQFFACIAKLVRLMLPDSWQVHTNPRSCKHLQKHPFLKREAKIASIVVAECFTDQIDTQKLGCMVQWCFMNGMQYVFLFDPTGEELTPLCLLFQESSRFAIIILAL